MNFIKKVFDNSVDESVHLQFQKFGKGIFKDRALIKAKNSNGKYTINTSAEFANELVRIVAEMLGSEKTKVTGAIVSTSDLTGKIDFYDKKQFQGVKRYMIDSEMSGNEIIEMLDKFPKSFFALSFECKKNNTSLKIKPKAPKSGKPSSKGDDTPKADFCKIVTTDSEIGKSFVFEKQDFKEAEITHTFVIENLIIPEELKNSKDFALIREAAKRKGKVIREAKIDGTPYKQEAEFEA